ncbi:TEL2-interacting protein 1 [Thoreauomyces humboldtii]|nr:TEL2-interacting protein 1 [Thoreauomyces humboldtii]
MTTSIHDQQHVSATQIAVLRQQAFQRLRPDCVRLMQCASPGAGTHKDPAAAQPLAALLSTISHLSASSDHGPLVLDGLFEYICAPILQLLQAPSPAFAAVEGALTCLLALLKGASPGAMPLHMYRELLVTLPLLIERGRIGTLGVKKPANQSNPPEELRAVGVECLSELLQRVDIPAENDPTIQREPSKPETEIFKRLDRPEYQPTLAHLVLVLLEVIDIDRNVDLQVAALRVLRDLAVCVHDADHVSQFLPAVGSTLVRVMVRDEKQSHRIIVGCLETFGAMVDLAMNDRACAQFLAKDVVEWEDLVTMAKEPGSALDTSSAAKPSPSPTRESRGRVVVRDDQWHTTTVVRLNRLFANSFTIRHHENWRVRLAFLQFSSRIILRCPRSMVSSTPILVETLVGYLNDDFPQVATECRNQLEAVSLAIRGQYSLTAILKKNFYAMMTALPHHVMQPDDRKKHEALQVINGYLLLLKDGIRTSMSTVLARMSIALLRIWTFDISNVKLVEDRTASSNLALLSAAKDSHVRHADAMETHRFPRKRYQHFRDDRVEAALSQMCRLLGFYGNANHLVDHFLVHVRSVSLEDFQAQAIKIVNEITLGAAGVGVNAVWDAHDIALRNANLRSINKLARSVMRDYVHSSLWDDTTSIDDSKLHQDLQALTLPGSQIPSIGAPRQRTMQDYNAVILKTCLLLEGMATQAQILGQDVQVLLMEALYILLENSGDANSAVSESAATALDVVALACGYPKRPSSSMPVIELILDNVDYVVNVVSRKLRHVSSNPRACLVLCAAVRIAGPEVVPFMDDSVDEILDAVDAWHSRSEGLCLALVACLAQLIETIAEGMDKEESTDSDKDPPSPSTSSVSDEFAGCSKEMVELYVKFGPTSKAGATPSPSLSKQATRIEEIERYFAERGKEGVVDNDGTSPLNSPAMDAPPHDPDSQPDTAHDQSKPDPPPKTHSETLTLKILSKLVYLLPTPTYRLRHLILSTLSVGLPLLSATDRDPTVHRLWPSVARRLGDGETWVVEEAMRCIGTLCRVASKGFVAKRVRDDVVGRVETVVDVRLGRTARTRGERRMVSEILGFVAEMVATVELTGDVVRRFLDLGVRCLGDEDEAIRLAGGEVVRACAKGSEVDAVWLGVWAGMLGARKVVDGRGRITKVPAWMTARTDRAGIECGTNLLRDLFGEEGLSLGEHGREWCHAPLSGTAVWSR